MKIIYRVHAIKRMFQRKISAEDVVHVLETGEVIENYPQDLPYPSRLVLGLSNKRPIHVVLTEDNEKGEMAVIMAYEPDSQQWGPDYKRRQKWPVSSVKRDRLFPEKLQSHWIEEA